MGLNFDAFILSTTKLREGVEKHKTSGEIEMLDAALPKFGTLHENTLLLQNVEYWDDYNPYYELMDFIERYFGTLEGYEIVRDSTIAEADRGANADEVADELGIELPAHPDDEDN